MGKAPSWKLPAIAAAVKQISPEAGDSASALDLSTKNLGGLWLVCTASEGKQTDLWACELIQSKPGTVYGDLYESQAEAQGVSPLSSLPRCIVVSFSSVH